MDQITIGVFAQISLGVDTDEPARTRTMAGNSESIAASPAIGNYAVAVQARASSTPDPLAHSLIHSDFSTALSVGADDSDTFASVTALTKYRLHQLVTDYQVLVAGDPLEDLFRRQVAWTEEEAE